MKKIKLLVIAIIIGNYLNAQDYQIDDGKFIANHNGTGWKKGLDVLRDGSVIGRFEIDPDNILTLGTMSSSGLTLRTNATNRLHITSNGNVGIGITSPSFLLTIGTNLNNAYQSTPDLASIGIMSHGVGSAQGNLYLHRDDVTISQNNVLGSVLFTGADGGEQVGAEIRGVSAGSWSSGQSSSDLVFLTTSGSSTPTEKVRIRDNGNVGIGTSSPSGSISSNQTGLHILNDNVSYLSLESTAGSGKKYTMYSSTAGSLVFWDASGSTMRGIIDVNGNWGIGTPTPLSKLSVNGHIRATEVKVLANVNVPDYVFEPDYELRTLKETKEYIIENKHLPEIPSATEIEENGIDLGDMNMRLLKKIEELTLYQIELMEKLEQQNTELQNVKKELQELKN